MKLEKQTLQILSNFASINPSILFKPGNVIQTITPLTKAVMGVAKVAETFPKRCAVFELSKFLAAVSMFKDPDISFGEHSVRISEGPQSIELTYAPEDSIVFSEKQLKMPEPDIEFNLTAETYQTLMKALGVLQLPEVAIQGDSSGIFIATVDTKNPSSNNYRVQIGPANGHDFNLIFRSENLKIIVTDYRVKITQRGFAHFESDIVEYFVAMEQRSKYE